MKLSIGEVSKIFNISRETLRYYDKIGILKPEINKHNGYRFYLLKHLEKLGMILGIKLLGISLSDIKQTIESENLNDYKNLILKQDELLQIKKKELEILEQNIQKGKNVLDTVCNFKNNYNFKTLKINYSYSSLYTLDFSLLTSNTFNLDNILIDKKLPYLNEDIGDNYIYIHNIIDNTNVKEDENIVFLEDNDKNNTLLSKYFKQSYIDSMQKEIIKKSISVDFYGTILEINEYILALNKFFNCPPNNSAYIIYKFFLPKKNGSAMYFVNIKLKI